MKVCFCDFDGVIWSYRTYQFSPEACKNLNDLLTQEPDLNIVISSSWRKLGMDQCKRTLDKNGIDSSRVIDLTGNEPEGRGKEIQDWLDRHPEVTSYVVLDDESSDMPKLLDRLVKPDRYIGLTKENVQQALDILKTPC
jgi:hypothetical protein